jgi:hypothetical protein
MKVTNPLKWLLKWPLWSFTCLQYYKTKEKCEECNILVSKCIGCVEPNKVVTMALKAMEKLNLVLAQRHSQGVWLVA